MSKKAMAKIVEINKQELSTEKVELALVDDLKDSILRGRNIEKNIKSVLSGYNGLLRAARNFKADYATLIKQAKELGIDPPAQLKGLEDIADGFEKKGQAIKRAYDLFR